MPDETGFDAVPLTQPPRHHFFGYYGIDCWNATGEYVLCLESGFHDRPPGPDDVAGVGIVELASGAFHRLAETRAFNLQQGSMLHWLPAAPDRQRRQPHGLHKKSVAEQPFRGHRRASHRSRPRPTPAKNQWLPWQTGRACQDAQQQGRRAEAARPCLTICSSRRIISSAFLGFVSESPGRRSPAGR